MDVRPDVGCLVITWSPYRHYIILPQSLGNQSWYNPLESTTDHVGGSNQRPFPRQPELNDVLAHPDDETIV